MRCPSVTTLERRRMWIMWMIIWMRRGHMTPGLMDERTYKLCLQEVQSEDDPVAVGVDDRDSLQYLVSVGTIVEQKEDVVVDDAHIVVGGKDVRTLLDYTDRAAIDS